MSIAATLVLAFTLVLVFSAHSYARTDLWEVYYETTDLTDAASPIPGGQSVLINVATIGPMLGISTYPEQNGVTLQTADGQRWRWQSGDASLVSSGRIIPLPVPAVQQGAALFLSPEVIAELSNGRVEVDTGVRRVTLLARESVRSPAVDTELLDGWRTFNVVKQASVNTETTARSVVTSPAMHLPPTHDRLRTGIGLGYVQGMDWGMQLTASGRILGGDVDSWALVTQGDRGARLHNSHLSWFDRENERRVEAGDLYNEAWGLVRGIRYAWGTGGGQEPSIGLFLKTSGTENRDTLVTYSQNLRLGPNGRARLEMGTDRSNYTNVAYEADHLGIFAFRRELPSGIGDSRGLFASWQLYPGASVFYGSNSSTDTTGQDSTSRTLGLRLPALGRCSLVLEQTKYDYQHSSLTNRSIGLAVPLSGSLNVLLRYQKSSSDIAVLAGSLINLHDDSSSLLTSLSLFASPRVHLDYQRSAYIRDGRTTYNEQLITNYRLSRDTALQAITGFPNVGDANLLRLRIDHRLQDDLSLLVEYGRLAPYQNSDYTPSRRGVMIMLRKTWTCLVPAGGGRVSGVVADQLGQPLEGIQVQLGSYTTVSDRQGRYRFDHVPTGNYGIDIVSASIPADYKVEANSREIRSRRGSTDTVDFALVPLGCISGHVYLDKDGDAAFDRGEGIPTIAVCLDAESTSTGRDGQFSFYNVEPGRHTVRVASEVLDKRFTVKGTERTEVDLRPDGSITGVEFQLEERRKPVLFVDLDQE